MRVPRMGACESPLTTHTHHESPSPSMPCPPKPLQICILKRATPHTLGKRVPPASPHVRVRPGRAGMGMGSSWVVVSSSATTGEENSPPLSSHVLAAVRKRCHLSPSHRASRRRTNRSTSTGVATFTYTCAESSPHSPARPFSSATAFRRCCRLVFALLNLALAFALAFALALAFATAFALALALNFAAAQAMAVALWRHDTELRHGLERKKET